MIPTTSNTTRVSTVIHLRSVCNTPTFIPLTSFTSSLFQAMVNFSLPLLFVTFHVVEDAGEALHCRACRLPLTYIAFKYLYLAKEFQTNQVFLIEKHSLLFRGKQNFTCKGTKRVIMFIELRLKQTNFMKQQLYIVYSAPGLNNIYHHLKPREFVICQQKIDWRRRHKWYTMTNHVKYIF